MSEVNNTATGAQNGQPAGDVQKAYENLQALYGKQTNELGESRAFIEKVTPILTKLDEQDPVLIEAIMDGTINADLIKDVKEGKLTKVEAAAVTQASKEVNKELGSKMNNLSDDDFEKLVAEKASKIIEEKTSEANTKIQALEEYSQKQEAEKMLSGFIDAHPDWEHYTEEVDAILDKRADKDSLTLDDLELVYDAAKARHLNKLSREGKDQELAEIAKLLVGAGSQNSSNGGDLPDNDNTGLGNPPRDANSFINW